MTWPSLSTPIGARARRHGGGRGGGGVSFRGVGRVLPSRRPTRVDGLAAGLGALFLVLAGCSLGDQEWVECRCTPDSNHGLFPGCPRMVAVTQGQREVWLTASGDTVDPAVEQVLVRGTAVRRTGVSGPGVLTTGVADCPAGQPLDLLQRTRPEYVLFNVQRVWESDSRNVTQYLDQLAEDYTFIPDPLDVQAHPEVYAAGADTLWGRDQERAFAQALLDPDRIRTIHFTRWYESSRDQRSVSEDGLRVTLTFPYTAEFTEPAGPTGVARTLGTRGWAEVDLVTPTLENPVWTLSQWRDRREATAMLSWGE